MRRFMKRHARNLPVEGSRPRGKSGSSKIFGPAKFQRGAFTLVELLVVIGILGVLAALITPAVFQARVSARNAAIKAEIDMLHLAIMNYKNEYGSFPPCVDSRYDGIAPPNTAIAPDTNVYQSAGEASRHLARLFPRADAVKELSPNPPIPSPFELSPNRTDDDTIWLTFLYAPSPPPAAADLHLNPHNALHSWLMGYTGSPVNPLTVGERKKLFDFDSARVVNGLYAPGGKPRSPYIYIDSSRYDTFSAGAPGSLTLGANRRTTTEYFNSDTFQILCAGLDEQFGTEDDLSNFWPGTRQDYLDSLE